MVSGSVDAENFDQAVNKIIGLGFVPIDVNAGPVKGTARKTRAGGPFVPFGSRVGKGEIALFTRQLSDMIDAGVPLIRSLNVVAGQIRNPAFEKIIRRVHDFVQNGGSLSDALTEHPRVFPRLYVSMVGAGEVSGQLNVILNRLADFIEKEQEIRSKVISSLIYPGLMLGVGILTIFVLLSFVIPRLTTLFEDLSATLPLPTVLLMAASDFLSRFWYIVLGVLAAAVYGFKRFTDSPEGRLWFDRVKLKTPIAGRFILEVEIGRFARTLGTLLESGVVIVSALESVWGVMDNAVLQNEVRKISQEVSAGSSLTAAMRHCRYFPEITVNMIAVGEEAGRLEDALFKLAASYEKRSDRAIKAFTSMLEPLLIVVIGSVVGYIVIAMLLPIFRMNLIIQ